MNALGDAARGDEWIVEAFGCDAERLADRDTLTALFDRMVDELELRPVGAGQWHVFPPPGGITGMLLLAESHLTVHTFPEHRSLCLNLFCCTPREPWQFVERLAELLGAERVSVRHLERSYGNLTPRDSMVESGEWGVLSDRVRSHSSPSTLHPPPSPT